MDSILDPKPFFDPKNVQHVKAFQTLMTTAAWPQWYLDLTADFRAANPYFNLAAFARDRMSEQYMNEALGIHAPPKMRPYLTVDCIILSASGPVRLLLIKRKNKPFGYALPGGHVDHGETVEAAVVREVEEETGMVLSKLSQFGVYSRPDRDPRGHTISVVFTAQSDSIPRAGDDAADAQWVPFHSANDLDFAFDHKRILTDYCKRNAWSFVRGD